MINKTLAADEIISEVRRHKQDIASEYGFDVVALGRALQAREASDPRFKKNNANRVVEPTRYRAWLSRDAGHGI